MAAMVQSSLFSWDALEARSDLDRLHLVRDHLPDERLVHYLEVMRGHGRDDYPVRAMWNALLAGIVYQPECRVCARDTRRVDPSPTGLAQGDNLLSPGRPAPGRCSASSGAVGALGLRTTLRRMTLRRV